MILLCLILTAAGLLSGSVMYSYYIPLLFAKKDVRKSGGDGNPGSTNAIRSVGLPVGLLCMALDVFKAFVPVFAAVAFFNLRGFYLVPVIAAPSVGHAFSPLLGFRGGKAVSTTFGSLLGITPLSRLVFLLAVVLFGLTFCLVIRPESVRVMIGALISLASALFFEPLPNIKIAFSILMLLLLFKHYINPDPGEFSVSLLRYTCDFKDHRLRLYKV